ncbi:MAG: hypothetical protein RIS70_3145 [Planctomycetota bacterium]|jgi:hypothetical protein
MKKQDILELGKVMSGLFSIPSPSLGIDIDGCVDECPWFFRIVTQVWPGKVFVVSYRSDRERAEAYLKERNIRFDELILVSSLQEKAEVVKQEGITIFFDDQPECLKHMPSDREIMLVRNGGNFDFDDKRWMFSEETGKLL